MRSGSTEAEDVDMTTPTPADPQVPAEPPAQPGGVPNPTPDPALGANPKGSGSSPASSDPAAQRGPASVTADPDNPVRPAGAPDGGREGEQGPATSYVAPSPGTAQGGATSQAAPGAPVTPVPGVGQDVGVGTSPSPTHFPSGRPASVTPDPETPARPAGSNTPPTTHPPVTGG